MATLGWLVAALAAVQGQALVQDRDYNEIMSMSGFIRKYLFDELHWRLSVQAAEVQHGLFRVTHLLSLCRIVMNQCEQKLLSDEGGMKQVEVGCMLWVKDWK